MTRKTVEVVIADEGRDINKHFIITEKSALDIERWAWRLFMASLRAGVDVPDNILNAGFSGLATFGLKALAGGGLSFEEVEPLLDDMLGDIQYVADLRNRGGATRHLMPDDIEEVATLLTLRKSWFSLHVNFSSADAKQS